MPAGGTAGDAEAVGVDVVVGSMEADEADGATGHGEDFGDGVFGLRAVDDGEDGVAALGQHVHEDTEEGVVDGFVGAGPTAGDHGDDADVVGVGFWGEDVHREGDAGEAAVDDILGARVGGIGGLDDGGEE